MKKALILVLLLIMPVVLAKSVTLYARDSYGEDDINITLVNIDKSKEKFIICVNNEKFIVTESGFSRKGYSIDVDDISKDNVELDIDIDSNCEDEDCECTGYCNNARCFSNEKYVPSDKSEEPLEIEDIEDDVSVGWYAIIIFVILFFAIVFIAYYIVKKKF